ncbi:MAG: hypothetical protein LBL67_00325 [Coriobacteriales bacterium]|jgi:ABC-type transport system involved in multi-copper enzyme maturation permease subunit|nr:hypothetical protein [Coriobacteriales bacterium]
MFRLIRADLLRILHKPSFFIYFGLLLLLYLAVTFVRLSSLDATALRAQAESWFGWAVALDGIMAFAAVYTDDLSARLTPQLAGSGLARYKLVLGKFCAYALLGLCIFAVQCACLALVSTVCGYPPSPAEVLDYLRFACKGWVMSCGFAAIAGILAFATQRAVIAIVAYLLLGLGVVGGLVNIALASDVASQVAPGASQLLFSELAETLTDSSVWASGGGADGNAFLLSLAGVLLWIAAALALTVLCFRRRELSF